MRKTITVVLLFSCLYLPAASLKVSSGASRYENYGFRLDLPKLEYSYKGEGFSYGSLEEVHLFKNLFHPHSGAYSFDTLFSGSSGGDSRGLSVLLGEFSLHLGTGRFDLVGFGWKGEYFSSLVSFAHRKRTFDGILLKDPVRTGEDYLFSLAFHMENSWLSFSPVVSYSLYNGISPMLGLKIDLDGVSMNLAAGSSPFNPDSDILSYSLEAGNDSSHFSFSSSFGYLGPGPYCYRPIANRLSLSLHVLDFLNVSIRLESRFSSSGRLTIEKALSFSTGECELAFDDKGRLSFHFRRDLPVSFLVDSEGVKLVFSMDALELRIGQEGSISFSYVLEFS